MDAFEEELRGFSVFGDHLVFGAILGCAPAIVGHSLHDRRMR